MKQKKKEENNLIFCIERQKQFATKSRQKSTFRNPSHKNEIRQFSITKQAV